MEHSKRKTIPFRITDVLEASSFFTGYVIVAVLVANSVFEGFKQSYLMLMAVGFVAICLIMIWLHHRK